MVSLPSSFAVRRVLGIIVAVTLLGVAACANKQDVLRTKLQGKGAERTYAVTSEQAWEIAKTVFRLEPTDAIEEHAGENYMITSQNAGPLSSGAYLGVFFERAGENATRVTFVARRKSATQAYPFLNETTFHRKFGQLVELLASAGGRAARLDPDKGPASATHEANAVDSGRDATLRSLTQGANLDDAGVPARADRDSDGSAGDGVAPGRAAP